MDGMQYQSGFRRESRRGKRREINISVNGKSKSLWPLRYGHNRP